MVFRTPLFLSDPGHFKPRAKDGDRDRDRDGGGDGDGDGDGSCLVKLHFYEVINHSSVFRKVLSDLQLKAGKEEGNEKKSLHQLRKEREADREERIQVQPFPFLNLVYFGNHRNQ